MKKVISLLILVLAICLKGIQGLELFLMIFITAGATGYVVASIGNLFYTKEELTEFKDES